MYRDAASVSPYLKDTGEKATPRACLSIQVRCFQQACVAGDHPQDLQKDPSTFTKRDSPFPAPCDAAASPDCSEGPQGSRSSSWLASSIISSGGEELVGSTAAAAFSSGVTSLNPLERWAWGGAELWLLPVKSQLPEQDAVGTSESQEGPCHRAASRVVPTKPLWRRASLLSSMMPP